MLASSIPYKFKTPWGASASAPNYITTPIPATSTGAAAGQDLGFPPITATPTGAGGAPPNINDVNGALNYETLWSQWLQAGAPVGYDATFSTNIGGYPKGAVIASATFPNEWISTVDNNVTDPDTGGAGWEDPLAARFPSSLTANGWKKYPDPNSPTGYFIEQWGFASCTTNSTTAVTMPIAFPNAFLHSVCGYGSVIGGGSGYYYSVGSAASSLTSIDIAVVTNFGSSTEGINWRTIGY